MDIALTWLEFSLLASVIGFAGYHLSFHADAIADKTGLGKNFVGIILLGTITSLPELMTGVSSVAVTDNPNLAMGDVFGSCVFNLFLVFFLDLVYRESSIFTRATRGQIITGTFGIIMLAFAAFSLAMAQLFPVPTLLGAGPSAYVIPVLYLMAMKFLYGFEKENAAPEAIFEGADRSIRKNVMIFTVSALVIVVCGTLLPFLGERIMHVMGWQASFVGTIFVSFATSLPEIAVTVSAMKLDAVDMAFSNLLGSNLFNLVMLSIDDFAYRKGALMKAAVPGHLITSMTAMMMTGVIILGFVQPPRRRFLSTVSRLSLFILLLFLMNCYVIYRS